MSPLLHERVEVMEADAAAIIGLRTHILRPGFPPGKLASYPEDGLATTSHWAATLAGDVVGCATFHLDPCPIEPGVQALRLRGMAVSQEHQGQRVGDVLMRHAMAQLAQRHDERTLWCNARLRAVTFYERLGFVRWGELFEIEGIGPHYVMSRPLA